MAPVGLRETARRAGVSHAVPAHHFGNLRGLLTAFALQGQRLLSAAMNEVGRASEPSTAERLVATAVGYARFGVEHPAHVEVMARLDVFDRDDPELRAVGQSNFDRLLQAVVVHHKHSWRRDNDPLALAVMVWSSVHGFVTLWLGGFVEERLRTGGGVGFTRSKVRPLIDLP